MSGKGKKIDNKLEIRTRRIFSEEFKRQKVQMLTNKRISILELTELYGMTKMTVYRWLYRYSPHHNKGTEQVIQMESEGAKNLALLKQIAELERIVGQKQLHIDFLEKMIELASDGLQTDIKKNFDTRPSSGFENESRKTASK